MTDSLIENSALVSALVDGELRDSEFTRAMAHLEHNSEARQNWHAYHVVGNVMRTGQADVSAHETDFVLRLRTKLQHETAPLNLQKAPEADSLPGASLAGANDHRWRLVVGLASMAAVAVLAWQGYQGLGSSGPQLAVAPSAAPLLAPAVARASPQSTGSVMIRDPQLDALLAAHRQFGGTSALQAPTGFLRNATFEEGAR
ncbi:MAG: RseA family anti-sigma factor [Rhodoferax sp.]|nr:RseA family anti-sigma factor [Rhodoferax sp.]